MRMVMKTVLGLVCLTLATAAQAEEVKGRIVSADGKPVAGAEVAAFWQFDNRKATAYDGAATGEDGSFSLEMDFYGSAKMLLAMNAERSHGGIVVLEPPPDGENGTIDAGEIKLVELVEFKGDFYNREFDQKPEWTNVYMSVPPGFALRIGSCPSDEAEFWFKLPPGDYYFYGYGRDVQRLTRDITLTADEPVLDIGTIDLEPTVIARYYGKEPPKWTVTDARGLPKDVSLKDFRGRWTLVEVWGFW